MANTFELIASSTVGSGGASSIDFTSIASTWTDLCLKHSLRATNANRTADFKVRINSNSSSYTVKILYGTGSATGSNSNYYTDALMPGIGNGASSTANTFSNGELYIPNYASSNYKSVSADMVQEDNQTEAYAVLSANLWSNTAAITSLSIIPVSGNIAQYSTAYLYGVKNA